MRLEVVVDLWLNSALQLRMTTTSELQIQFAHAMRSESDDLSAAFKFMVNDLVNFCRIRMDLYGAVPKNTYSREGTSRPSP
jgi:hypothetical protein